MVGEFTGISIEELFRPIKVGRPHNTVSANAPVTILPPQLLVSRPPAMAPLAAAGLGVPGLLPGMAGIPGLAGQHLLQQRAASLLAAQQAALAAQKAQAQPLNTPVAGPPARIYIGSVLFDVKESEVKQIFQVFGSIKQISMIPNPENGKHKGYGFIEYEKHDDAVQAIQAMNGFQLAGRPLKVGWASSAMPDSAQTSSEDKTSNPIIVAAANAIADKVTTSLVTSSSNDITTVEDEENLSVSSVLQRKEIMCKLANRPSRVVLLKNMVEPEDVDPLLEQEIAEECSKFGKVNKVLIVTMVEQGSRLVKVFVEFGDQEAATKAVARLDKRWFGGKIVNASTYEEERFVRQDLSG